VWAGPDSQGGALDWYDLANPGIISIPLGFLGCFLGTMLSREEKPAFMFDELWVRSETGLGAEAGTGNTLTGRRNGTPVATNGARADVRTAAQKAGPPPPREPSRR
jgi:hypothetical protein